MKIITKRILHLFCGAGGSALGAQAAAARLGDHEARFVTVGGVDVDERACRDFERLTGAAALCADMHLLQPAQLRALCGDEVPDVVMASPPCKGFSALLSAKNAASEKYVAMNRLFLEGLLLVCSAWDRVPPIIFIENVPRIESRGSELITAAKRLLELHGYKLATGNHDCGELGGLAQHRERWFLLARQEDRVPQCVYQPGKQRVRACGEVLGPLPMPGDPAGGPMHTLPRLSWKNWVRLALIPAGGDWRDLPGVVPPGKQRREVHRRQAVADWNEPTDAVVGPGGAAAENVADPRFTNIMQVAGWAEPARTVVGATRPGGGALSVADPRIAKALGLSDNPTRHWNKYSVSAWGEPARAVIGAVQPGSGGPAVADPRIGAALKLGAVADHADAFHGSPGLMGVYDWAEPVDTITAGMGVSRSNTPAAVADPRGAAWGGGKGSARDGVLEWDGPAGAITGDARPSKGAFSVADPRLTCRPRAGAYKVLRWDEAASAITGSMEIDNGPAAIADPRLPRLDPDKPPPFVPIIIAKDGTWHRPLTTYELAILQSFPTTFAGSPLVLDGKSHTRWRQAIGNAVPPAAAQAVCEQILQALLVADLNAFALSNSDIWVAPESLGRLEVLQ